MNEQRRAVLRAICDTVVPSLERAEDPDGFWARSASDVGTPEALEDVIEQTFPEDQREGVGELLDGLAELGFLVSSRRSREQLLRNLFLLGTEAAAGGAGLTGLALFLAYGAPDPQTGQNPFWKTLGFPGPVSPAPQAERALKPLVPEGDELQLDADVCIVGSGAGGGVIAGELAAKGLKVVVLEAGGYFDESDFNQLELPAYQNMYWRGGPQQSADLNVSLMAGTTLGGGTTINWTNCLRTTPWVREQWAREFGLEGVDGPGFDAHLDAVLERLKANDRCSELNGTQTRMKEGAEALGWSYHYTTRNVDPELYSPDTAGYIGFGDQSGAKQSTAKTYLADAAEKGAELVARCTVQRVLTEGGRATGVEALYADPATGHTAQVTVRAPRVVVACGSLESPALLLRSGIGGPAVGQNLRLHPCTAVFAYYEEDQRAWWGAPHALVIDEFANVEDDYGFLVEASQYTTGLGAASLPFVNAEQHKGSMERYAYGASVIGLLRDRGGGRVTIDDAGQALAWYSLDDELDVRNSQRALDAQIRMHHAAGAREIAALAAGAPTWTEGDDVEAFIARCQRVPLQAGGHKLFSAHQMGTCRMGPDPQTSVANPDGELHDTPGVWIGDGSAFPTSSGTNPMITIMALARRTAEAIHAASPAEAAGAAAK
jgi:choline dehydrogenase-like flavoprotein